MPPRTKIFVGHLPDGCKTTDLQALFEKYGAVAECDVINKYGFVHMTSQDEAEAAIKALNNFNFMGSCISVEQSTSKLHPEPGAPGRAKGGMGPMGGFRGGRGGPQRNGYGSRDSYYSSDSYYDDYRRFDGPPLPPRDMYFGRERPRPYPMPYERRLPPLRDDPYRRLDDPYARRPPPPPPSLGVGRDEPFERRQRPPPDYLYTRRSPPPPSHSDLPTYASRPNYY